MTAARPVPDDQRAAVLAGFLGWTLDAFDFFLVVMTLTAIARDFGRSDAAIALSITLTLAFRPVGAFIFGLMADRYGRRLPLMLDLVFFSLVEVLTGLAPSYRSFLVLRALFGIVIVGNAKLFFYLVLLMTMMNFVSHGTQDLYPTFLQRDWGFTPQRRAALTALSMVGALTGGTVMGLFSDRLGRRRTIVLTLIGAFLTIPLWAF